MRYCVVYFGQSKNTQKSGEKISTAGFASFIWTNVVGMWSCRLILSSTDVPWIKHRLCKQILALAIIFSCLPDVCFRCHTSAAGVAHIWQRRLGLKKVRFTAVNEDLHDISHICLMLLLISSVVWIICSNSTRSIHAGRNPTLDTKCQNDSDCKNLRVLQLHGCFLFTFYLLPYLPPPPFRLSDLGRQAGPSEEQMCIWTQQTKHHYRSSASWTEHRQFAICRWFGWLSSKNQRWTCHSSSGLPVANTRWSSWELPTGRFFCCCLCLFCLFSGGRRRLPSWSRSY